MYLDWKEKSKERPYYVIDIETNGLKPTEIYVLCWENIRDENDKGSEVGPARIKAFLERTRESYYIGHNILGYDRIWLERLIDFPVSAGSCIDTFVLSTLYSPNIVGGHSLGVWGDRLGYDKFEFNDWSRYSEEMRIYCERDVALTANSFVD